jgi:hypothetical protein
MTCDCKKSLETKLAERFKESAPEAKDHAVSLQGYALILGEKLEQKGCMPIHCTATYPLKKGGTKEKTVKQNMIFTYCPFCGVAYG